MFLLYLFRAEDVVRKQSYVSECGYSVRNKIPMMPCTFLKALHECHRICILFWILVSDFEVCYLSGKVLLILGFINSLGDTYISDKVLASSEYLPITEDWKKFICINQEAKSPPPQGIKQKEGPGLEAHTFSPAPGPGGSLWVLGLSLLSEF